MVNTQDIYSIRYTRRNYRRNGGIVNMDNTLLIIVGFAVSLLTLITPIIKLNTTITELNTTVKQINNTLIDDKKELNEHTDKLQNHEIRLVKIEERGN